MRIELSTEGGFVAAPGLEKPVILDSGSLPPEQCEACEHLVREVVAGAGNSPVQARAAAQVRDGRTYRMKIHLDHQSVSVDASDGAMSPAYRQLVKLVRTHGAR
ncbi:hypothetical protein GJV26_28715 [Massilia dura]|uniref:Uncharacterized protein n=1 Tax=Pseudoduganella dura TaxID=321982 RepID=A0A6I3XIT7_9BURK|nr:protealysin inhibitor emfourin [Pseudoduganella dura]MUI16409.1 hypothetical protein [Pseudoduganella dura]